MLVIIICSTTFLGQSYYPLIEDNKTWNVLNIISCGGWPPFDTSYNTSSYYISGDTIIGNTQYKKMFNSSEEVPVNWILRGLIREDSVKRVWLKWPMNSDEELLYNFSVVAGDSLTLRHDTTFYFSVDSITNINIHGDSRKKYWISQDEFDWNETWVEGIGSNRGITNSGMAMAVGGWSWLLCMSEFEELVYMNPEYNTCYLLSTAVEETNTVLFNVYPNPTKDYLTIKNTGSIRIQSVSIINSFGQIIKHFDHGKTQLDVSDIEAGVVFLKISSDQGDIFKKIIIKE